MGQTDFARKIKLSHDDYYRHTDGPIGGGDRFEWVVRTFSGPWQGLKVLEIGCGEGTLLKMLAARNEVHGVDISKSGVERTVEKGIPCHHLDASNESLPYPDGFFDVVITLETIEHVENPHRMLWEIKRVLKSGGALLISIPGEAVYHPFIYPGLFTRRSFSEFLGVNSFEVLQIKGWGQAPMLAHWVKRVREGRNAWLKRVADLVYYVGRKRNLLFRKRLGTPLNVAYTVNFLCRNVPASHSRAETVGHLTTPD